MGESHQVDIFNGHPNLTTNPADVASLFQELDRWSAYRIPGGALSVALLTDSALASIHQSFLDDASTTDVITFPGSQEGELEQDAGEICVSVDTAIREAHERNISLGDEMALYLVHGWLHLAGLSDKSELKAREMRSAEAEALSYLKAQSAIPEFVLKGIS
jgi:probable rRNA maturation factor